MQKLKSRLALLKNSNHPIRLLIAFFLRKLRLSQLFFIQKDLYKLRFYPTALLMHLWADRSSRANEELLLGRMVKCGSVVVDVGANVGTLAMALSYYIGKSGKVYAIEAHPRIFDYLQKNVAFNGGQNIVTINKAIGDMPGKLYFSDLSSDDQNAIVSQNERGLEIEIETLENVLKPYDIRTIRLLKIDVEGYEYFVLQGADLLLQKVEIIYFESWEEHFKKYGYSTQDILKFLDERGFEIFRFVDECELEKVAKDYISKECENLLAIKDTKILSEIYERN